MSVDNVMLTHSVDFLMSIFHQLIISTTKIFPREAKKFVGKNQLGFIYFVKSEMAYNRNLQLEKN